MYIKTIYTKLKPGAHHPILVGILEKTGTDTRARTDGHGQTDTKDGQLWKRRALMEKTDSYGKDGHLWKRRTVMEKTGTYGKDGQLWKRRALMEKTDSYGKDRNKVFKSEILSRETHTAHNRYYTYCK